MIYEPNVTVHSPQPQAIIYTDILCSHTKDANVNFKKYLILRYFLLGFLFIKLHCGSRLRHCVAVYCSDCGCGCGSS